MVDEKLEGEIVENENQEELELGNENPNINSQEKTTKEEKPQEEKEQVQKKEADNSENPLAIKDIQQWIARWGFRLPVSAIYELKKILGLLEEPKKEESKEKAEEKSEAKK